MDHRGRLKGVHAQDPIHVCKKLDCKLDSVKVLEMGYYTCCHSHLQHIYDVDSTPEGITRCGQQGGQSAGLWRTDVRRQDRQNFMACVRRAGYRTRRALVALQPAGPLNMSGASPQLIARAYVANNSDPLSLSVLDAVFLGRDNRPWGSKDLTKPGDIRTHGTVAFYVLNAAYMLIHHSRYFGDLQRVRFAGFTNMFVAHWRCWVMKTPNLTLKNNFLTKECYSDLVLSCHEAVLQTIVFAMHAPSLPLGLKFSGSNVCENSFSSAGGYRGIFGNRNYTILDYLEWEEKQYVMRCLEIAGIRRGRAQHRKQEWDSRYHEPNLSSVELDRILTEHHRNVLKTRSWNAGAMDASIFAEMLGLKVGVPQQAWDDPWTAMREKLHVAEVDSDTDDSDSDDSDTDDSDSDDSDTDDSDSDTEGEDSDELKPFVPPITQTCSHDDVRVAVFQFFKRLFDKKKGGVDNDRPLACLTVVEQFLFVTANATTAEDDAGVDDLLCLFAKDVVTVKPSKEERLQRMKNRVVTLPGTDVEVSKKQFVEMMVQDVLRCGRADGTSLSKDRIARIKATAARVQAEKERRVDAAVDGERVCLQDDLAFCFLDKNKKKKLWIGKLQQMRSKCAGRRRNVHDSISLTNPPQDLTMQLQWYHEAKRGRYVPTRKTVNVDKSFVDVAACLGLVTLEYKHGYYTLADNGQLRRFRRLMSTIK